MSQPIDERDPNHPNHPKDRSLPTRRAVIAGTSGAALACLTGSLAGAVPSAVPVSEPGAMTTDDLDPTGLTLAPGATVLFQGDSITDAGRDRGREAMSNDWAAFGHGYARLVAWHLLSKYANHDLKCFNRGISGHKVFQLQERWEADCIALQPDLVSILIGVNDIWHHLNGQYDGTPADYRDQLTTLLGTTRDRLPNAGLVVCEPFVLRCGAVTEAWFPEMDERRAIAAEVAAEAGATWVGFQSMFDAAVTADSAPAAWAGDGVHPSAEGAALMAMRWLSDTGL